MKYVFVTFHWMLITICFCVAGYATWEYVVKKGHTPPVAEVPTITVQLPTFSETVMPHRVIFPARVSDMKIGDVGWIWPDHLLMDEKKVLWVYKGTRLYSDYSEDYSIKIQLLEDGFEVWLDRSDKSWAVSNSISTAHGSEAERWLKINTIWDIKPKIVED